MAEPSWWASGYWWYWQAFRTWVPYSRAHMAALEQTWLTLADGERATVQADGERHVVMARGENYHVQERVDDASLCRQVARIRLDHRAVQELSEGRPEYAQCTLRHMSFGTLQSLDAPGHNPHGTSRLNARERSELALSGVHSIASLQRTAAEQLAALGRDDWIIGWEDPAVLADGRVAGYALREQRGITEVANGRPVPICPLGMICTSTDPAHHASEAHPFALLAQVAPASTLLQVPVNVSELEGGARVIDTSRLQRFAHHQGAAQGAETRFFCGVAWNPHFFRFRPDPHATIKQLNGYSALLAEVRRNGHQEALDLPEAVRQPGRSSLEDVVVEKSLNDCQQRQTPNDRLDYAEILAILLYTGTDVQDDMHRAHRVNQDYERWSQLRCALMSAISKLHRTLPVHHDRPAYLYHGSRRRIFDIYEAIYPPEAVIPYCDFFSTSTSAHSAQGFIGDTKGLLLQVSRTPTVECADVSWISKHEHEAEILINPCVLRRRGEVAPSILRRSSHSPSAAGFILVQVEADSPPTGLLLHSGQYSGSETP
jgi:hypothetical protein